MSCCGWRGQKNVHQPWPLALNYYCDPGSTRELVRGLAAWGHYASARRLALWVLSPGHPARKRGVHEHDEEVR